uniref:Uncharacterized protein n=1 Tax=Rhizophora mucronata TaxID=61149 RepID=A0A2P2NM66_RHIMU
MRDWYFWMEVENPHLGFFIFDPCRSDLEPTAYSLQPRAYSLPQSHTQHLKHSIGKFKS